MRIDHSRPDFDKEDKASLLSVLNSNFVSNGSIAEKFADKICKITDRQYGIAVQSGTDALTCALKALSLPAGAEIAVPAYICSAPLDALASCGLKAIPVDIDRNTLGISPEAVNKRKNLSGVIAAHLFGIPSPFFRIRHPGLIEDCAQTLGTEIEGHTVGSMGAMSICSFYATKLLTSGHGGMLLTDNREIYHSVNMLLMHDKQEKLASSFCTA